MKLKRVGRISVSGFFLQIAGQVDDVDGLKGALLDADTASDAQLLGDGGNLVVHCHLDTEFAHSNN